MASLSDLANVFNQAPPSQFQLASTGVQSGLTARQAQRTRDRSVEDFGERFLPDMLDQQAARGAYATSATRNRASRASQDLSRGLTDLAAQGASGMSQAAVNSLLASTGIRI